MFVLRMDIFLLFKIITFKLVELFNFPYRSMLIALNLKNNSSRANVQCIVQVTFAQMCKRVTNGTPQIFHSPHIQTHTLFFWLLFCCLWVHWGECFCHRLITNICKFRLIHTNTQTNNQTQALWMVPKQTDDCLSLHRRMSSKNLGGLSEINNLQCAELQTESRQRKDARNTFTLLMHQKKKTCKFKTIIPTPIFT